MKNHVTKFFLDWVENSITEERKKKIESHLTVCDKCREYYRQMEELFRLPDQALLSDLEPDPFLPTRIQAGTMETTPLNRASLPFSWIRWSLSGLVVMGTSIGIFIGSSVFRPSTFTDRELAAEYYEAFATNDGVNQLESAFNLQNGEGK
jgi:predicted anti-sigma-YlaC factor YlaD